MTVLNDKIQKHFNHPIYCVLHSKGIFTIGQMLSVPDKELMSIRNFGVKAQQKVQEFRLLTLNP